MCFVGKIQKRGNGYYLWQAIGRVNRNFQTTICLISCEWLERWTGGQKKIYEGSKASSVFIRTHTYSTYYRKHYYCPPKDPNLHSASATIRYSKMRCNTCLARKSRHVLFVKNKKQWARKVAFIIGFKKWKSNRQYKLPKPILISEFLMQVLDSSAKAARGHLD